MNNTIIACVKFISWNEYETITSQGYIEKKGNSMQDRMKNVGLDIKVQLILNEKKKILIHSDEEK